MNLNRRRWLQTSSRAALAAGIGGLSLSHRAQAMAEPGDYRALVCVFLLGGMDGHDLLLPYDQTNYDHWAGARSSMLGAYSGARDRGQLRVLAPDNASAFSGRQFALPPEMPNLQRLFQAGDAAFVGNVGPLVRPTTKAAFEAGTVPLPPRLFSHNDQQSTWMSSSPEGARFGWGGFFADSIAALNGSPVFTGITSGGNDLFLTGNQSFPFQIGLQGAASLGLLEEIAGAEIDLFREHFRPQADAATALLDQDVANALRNAFDANESYGAALASQSALQTGFPESYLGAQLRAVARTIAARDALNATRQVFIVSAGGFDTHSEQARALPGLLADIDAGIDAFQRALVELGLVDKVTLFTASEFGRTLAVNGDGTDHGWGGHQILVGGGVRGRVIHGDLPSPEFGHDQDAGSGRLIPTTAVEQLAAPLGAWLGLDGAQVSAALPNLASFGEGLSLHA
ncbi:MAG: DUF1501 domain-containing protein [Pseudomonadota bacterium]